MTKQGENGTKGRQAGTEVDLTEAMVAAGVDALREHHIGDDMRDVVEDIFFAMWGCHIHAACVE